MLCHGIHFYCYAARASRAGLSPSSEQLGRKRQDVHPDLDTPSATTLQQAVRHHGRLQFSANSMSPSGGASVPDETPPRNTVPAMPRSLADRSCSSQPRATAAAAIAQSSSSLSSAGGQSSTSSASSPSPSACSTAKQSSPKPRAVVRSAAVAKPGCDPKEPEQQRQQRQQEQQPKGQPDAAAHVVASSQTPPTEAPLDLIGAVLPAPPTPPKTPGQPRSSAQPETATDAAEVEGITWWENPAYEHDVSSALSCKPHNQHHQHQHNAAEAAPAAINPPEVMASCVNWACNPLYEHPRGRCSCCCKHLFPEGDDHRAPVDSLDVIVEEEGEEEEELRDCGVEAVEQREGDGGPRVPRSRCCHHRQRTVACSASFRVYVGHNRSRPLLGPSDSISGSDSLQVGACCRKAVAEAALRTTAVVRCNPLYEPGAGDNSGSNNSIRSDGSSSSSITGSSLTGSLHFIGVLLYGNELYEPPGPVSGQASPFTACSGTATPITPLKLVAAVAAAVAHKSPRLFSPCKGNQQQQAARGRTVSTSSPAREVPRYSWSTVSSRAKAARRDVVQRLDALARLAGVGQRLPGDLHLCTRGLRLGPAAAA